MNHVKEYIEAAARLALALEGRVDLEWDEWEYCQDTLVELLERCNDVVKPVVEDKARRKG